MHTEESKKIVERFFEVLYTLKDEKVISGKITFIRRYGLNERNFWLLEQDKSRNIFQVSWLSYLVNDYGVSAEWLLTGNGEMFKTRPEPLEKVKVKKEKRQKDKPDSEDRNT
jgi:hypothetical protein